MSIDLPRELPYRLAAAFVAASRLFERKIGETRLCVTIVKHSVLTVSGFQKTRGFVQRNWTPAVFIVTQHFYS